MVYLDLPRKTCRSPRGSAIETIAASAGRRARSLLLSGLATAFSIGMLSIGEVGVSAEPNAAPAKANAAGHVWLGDLPVKEAKVGWKKFGKPGFIGETYPIALNGFAAPHGLSTPAEATVTFEIGKRFRSFQAAAALADSANSAARRTIVFQVLADDKMIWKSKAIGGGQPWQPCLLDVTGVERLTLKVDYPAGDADRAVPEVFAVWLEPSVSPAPLDARLAPLFDQKKFLEYDALLAYDGHVAELWASEKFAELEQMAKEARAERKHLLRFSKLQLFYSMLQGANAESEQDYLKLLERAARWQKQFADSATPRIVAAGLWEQMAIASHGADFAVNVTQEGWRLFTERMAKAGALLEEAEPHSAGDPELYHRYLWAAFAQNWTSDRIEDLVDKAIRIDPGYSPVYGAMAFGLLPRWRGQPGDAANFALRIRDRVGGEEGQIAYFNVASVYYGNERARAVDAQFDRGDLKAALRAAVKRYPGDDWLVQMACWMACLNRDMETARMLFERIPRGGGGTMWGEGDNAEIWRRWADPQRPPGEESKTLWQGEPKINALALSPDGTQVFVAANNTAYGLEVESGKIVRTVAARGRILSLAVDPDAARLLVSSSSAESPLAVLRLYKLGADEPEALSGHRRFVRQVTFNSAGTRAATAGSDHRAMLWKLDDLDDPIELASPGDVLCVDFSPDGKTLATTTTGGGIRLWDGETGAAEGEPLAAEGGGRTKYIVRFMPDGRKLVAVAGNGAVEVWDRSSRRAVAKIAGGGPEVWSSALARDGRFVAVGRASGDIDLFATSTLRLAHTFHGHWAPVAGIAFLSDDQTLISGAHDGSVKLWDLKPLRGAGAARR